MDESSRRPRVPWQWRIGAAAATFAALALLAWSFAHWGWRWLGPAPVSIAGQGANDDWARRIGDARLFGAASPASARPPAAAVLSTDARLLGVFAQRNGKGYALFRLTQGPKLVSLGEELSPGVRLDAVRPEGVTLREGGIAREIVLRPSASTGTGEKPRPAPVAASEKSSACAVPPGFGGQVVRLNAELLGGMINAPETWQSLLQTGAGALIVRDQSGFAGMLGLQSGDRIERANGIALVIPEDIAPTVLQPLTKSQPVWVAGIRDGRPRQWLYLNAGACPG